MIETRFLYLREMMGFLIQTMPCVWLCLFPIAREDLRVDKWKLVLGSGIWFAALGLGLGHLVERYGVTMTHSGGQNFYMLGALLAFILAYWILVRVEIYVKALLLGLAFIYAAFLYILVNMSAFWTGKGDHYGDPYNRLFLVLFIFWTAILYPLLLLGLRGRLRAFIYKRELQMKKHSIRLLILADVAFLVLILTAAQTYNSPSLAGYTLVMYICALVMLVTIYWYVIDTAMKEKEYMEYSAQVDLLDLQFHKIQKEVESMRRQSHDIRHHNRLIQTLLEEDRCDEALQYLQSYQQEISGMDTVTYCQEPFLNALLQYYMGDARGADITCDVLVEFRDCPIDRRDMIILLGNCLENAIRACKLVPREERRLFLRIREVNSTLAVILENSCKEVHYTARRQSETGFLPADAFQSTRQNGGLGLRSITSIAEKYKGTAEFRYDNHTFYTRVLLEIPNTINW